MNQCHILFLFSDTGGGHRSAAEAIIEALHLEYGNAVSAEMVDVFKQYAPHPINQAPEIYPVIVRMPELWELGYHLSNGRRRVNLINASVWPYVRRSMRRLISQHPSDLIVSVHPLVNAPMLRAMRPDHAPYAIVVTDLVTTHAFWYNPGADLTVVPTEEARQQALSLEIPAEKIRVVGLPVADRCCQPVRDKTELRRELGWGEDRPLVLLVGGGDGMGPLEQTAHAIANAGLPVSLVIVAGRNEKLKARLEVQDWSIPTHIYGFTREMPTFMQAADVLVTKAGPGTISEALNAGLPMILYSHLPGQEDGNLSYVTENGAGIHAPRPDLIVSTLQKWVNHPEEHAQAVAACRHLARPQAARQIAHVLVDLCQKTQSGLGRG